MLSLRSRYDLARFEQFLVCLTNDITRQVIVLESCSNPQKNSASLRVRSEKKFLVLGFGFFVSDVITGVVLGIFGPLNLAMAETARW